MFGSSAPAGGGLFGAAQPSGGLFGASQPSAGLFGASQPQQQPQQQQQQQGGGLFGTPAPAAAAPGGLFSSQGGSSTGLFGTSAPAPSGGLFGTSQPNAAPQNGGGLFGSSQPSLFNPPQQGGGLLASSHQQQQQQPQSGGLFGGSSLFGQSQQQQQQQSSLFGQPPPQQQQQQQQLQPASLPWWYRELMRIQLAYEPGQGCRFQTMLYEVLGLAPDLLVHSGAVALSHVDSAKAQRKRLVLQANPWIDEREWQRAEDKNPDPVNWMPSPIVGINALYSRVEQQAAHVRMQLDMLTQPAGRSLKRQAQLQQGQQGQQQLLQQQQKPEALQLTTINETPDDGKDDELATASARHPWMQLEVDEPEEQIEQCRHEHVRLNHRLIKALGRLELLQCANMRGGRTAGELEFDRRLQRLEGAMADPRGCRAQLSSIVTQLELEDHQESNVKLSLRTAEPGEFAALQEQDQLAILNFLELQREGIDSLMKIVRRDMRDLDIIKRRTQAESHTLNG
jgi:hypothetical protein